MSTCSPDIACIAVQTLWIVECRVLVSTHALTHVSVSDVVAVCLLCCYCLPCCSSAVREGEDHGAETVPRPTKPGTGWTRRIGDCERVPHRKGVQVSLSVVSPLPALVAAAFIAYPRSRDLDSRRCCCFGGCDQPRLWSHTNHVAPWPHRTHFILAFGVRCKGCHSWPPFTLSMRSSVFTETKRVSSTSCTA